MESQFNVPPRMLFRSESPSSTATSVHRITASEEPLAAHDVGLSRRRGPGGGLQASPVAREPNIAHEQSTAPPEVPREVKVLETANVPSLNKHQNSSANADLFARFEALQRELQRSRNDANNNKLQTPTKDNVQMSKVYQRFQAAANTSVAESKQSSERESSPKLNIASGETAYPRPPVYPTSGSPPSSPFHLRRQTPSDDPTKSATTPTELASLIDLAPTARDEKVSRPKSQSIQNLSLEPRLAASGSFYDTPHLSPTVPSSAYASVLSTIHSDDDKSPRRTIAGTEKSFTNPSGVFAEVTNIDQQSRDGSGDSDPTLQPNFSGTLNPQAYEKKKSNARSGDSSLRSSVLFTPNDLISSSVRSPTPTTEASTAKQNQLFEELHVQVEAGEYAARNQICEREWTTFRTLELEERVGINNVLTKVSEVEKQRSEALQEELVRLLRQKREASRSASPRYAGEITSAKPTQFEVFAQEGHQNELQFTIPNMAIIGGAAELRIPSISASTGVSTHSVKVSPTLEAYGGENRQQQQQQQPSMQHSHPYYKVAPRPNFNRRQMATPTPAQPQELSAVTIGDNSALYVSAVRNDEDIISTTNHSFATPSLEQEVSSVAEISPRRLRRDLMAPKDSAIFESPPANEIVGAGSNEVRERTPAKEVRTNSLPPNTPEHVVNQPPVTSEITIHHFHHGAQHSPRAGSAAASVPNMNLPTKVKWPIYENFKSEKQRLDDEEYERRLLEKERHRQAALNSPRRTWRDVDNNPPVSSRSDNNESRQTIEWSSPAMNRSQRLREQHNKYVTRSRTAPPTKLSPRRHKSTQRSSSSTIYERYEQKLKSSSTVEISKREHRTVTPTRMAFGLSTHTDSFVDKQNELHSLSVFRSSPTQSSVPLKSMTPPPRVMGSIHAHVERLKQLRQAANQKVTHIPSDAPIDPKSEAIVHGKQFASRSAPDTKLLLDGISGKISLPIAPEANTDLPHKGRRLLSPPQLRPPTGNTKIDKPQNIIGAEIKVEIVEPLKTPNVSDLQEADLRSPERHLPATAQRSVFSETIQELEVVKRKVSKIIPPLPKGYRGQDLREDYKLFSSPQRQPTSKISQSPSRARNSISPTRSSVDRFTEDSDEEMKVPASKPRRASLPSPAFFDGYQMPQRSRSGTAPPPSRVLYPPTVHDDISSVSSDSVTSPSNVLAVVNKDGGLVANGKSTQIAFVDNTSLLSIPKESIIVVNLSHSTIDATTTAAMVASAADKATSSTVVIVNDSQTTDGILTNPNGTNNANASNFLYNYSEAVHEQQYKDLLALRRAKREARKRGKQEVVKHSEKEDKSFDDQLQHYSDPSFSNPKGRSWRPGANQLRDIITPSKGAAYLALVDHGSSSDSSQDARANAKANREQFGVGAAQWALINNRSYQREVTPTRQNLYEALSPLTPQVIREPKQVKQNSLPPTATQNWMASTASWKGKKRPTGSARDFVLQNLLVGNKPHVNSQKEPNSEAVYWEKRRQLQLKAVEDIERYKQRGAMLRNGRNEPNKLPYPAYVKSDVILQQVDGTNVKHRRASSEPKLFVRPQAPTVARAHSQPRRNPLIEYPQRSTVAKEKSEGNYYHQFLLQKQNSPVRRLPQIVHDTKHVNEYLASERHSFIRTDTTGSKEEKNPHMAAQKDFNKNPYLPKGFSLDSLESKPQNALLDKKLKLSSERTLSKLQRDALQRYKAALAKKR